MTLLRRYRLRRRPAEIALDCDVLRVDWPSELRAVRAVSALRQLADQLSCRRHIDSQRSSRIAALGPDTELSPASEIIGLLDGDSVRRSRAHGEPGGSCNATVGARDRHRTRV